MGLALFEDFEEAHAQLATDLLQILGGGLCQRRLALCGGRTPEPIYERLRENVLARRFDCSRFRVYVTDDILSSRANEGKIRRLLCDPLGIPCIAPSADELAALRAQCTEAPLFHAVVLGVGADGHTASLFNAADSDCEDDVLRTISPTGEARISLGLSALAQARRIFLVAAGADKSEAVEQLLCGGRSSGAIIARWPQTTCVFDKAAASLISSSGNTV